MFGRASVRTDRRPCISIWSLRAPESHWGARQDGRDRREGEGGCSQSRPPVAAGRHAGRLASHARCDGEAAGGVAWSDASDRNCGAAGAASCRPLLPLPSPLSCPPLLSLPLPCLSPPLPWYAKLPAESFRAFSWGLRLEMGEGRGARRFHSRLSARCGLSVRLRLRDCGPGLAQDDAPFADSDEGFRVSGHG
jgi:hypothetical protein